MSLVENVKAARKELKERERALASAKSDRKSRLKSLDSKIERAREPLVKPEAASCGVALYLDRIEYDGKAYRLDSSVEVDVAANGLKTDTSDTRSLYLTVSTDQGAFVANCDPDLEKRVRELGASILNAAPTAEVRTAEQLALIRILRVQRMEAESDYAAIDAAQTAVDDQQDAIDRLVASASEQDQLALQDHDRKRKLLKIGGIVVAVLLVLLVGGILFGGSGSQGDEGPATNPQKEAVAGAASSSSKAVYLSNGPISIKGNAGWRTQDSAPYRYIFPDYGAMVVLADGSDSGWGGVNADEKNVGKKRGKALGLFFQAVTSGLDNCSYKLKKVEDGRVLEYISADLDGERWRGYMLIGGNESGIHYALALIPADQFDSRGKDVLKIARSTVIRNAFTTNAQLDLSSVTADSEVFNSKASKN
ncbi:MAG: hypothetical protein Q4D06_02525 [Coriobacteriia bacterium]|nr:hypothetical protein [Coriobacteriia bacterium]